jgi:nucleotide-binding universal stress UspA family protein
MKILAAVDGSACSLTMLEMLGDRLAWFRDPSITLVYVHPALPYKRAVAWAGKDAVQKYYDEESEAALASARAILAKRNLGFDVQLRVGDAAGEIVRAATEGHADVIAMGTRGHTALATLVMGSTATKVIATTSTPVLLLK